VIRHVLVFAVVLAASCGTQQVAMPASTPVMPTTFIVQGQIMLPSSYTSSANCQGSGGYDDIVIGAPVTVTDPSQKIIALGRISNGSVNATTGECALNLFVPNVPEGYEFYGV
jgi:hypothetical protein